MLKTKLDPNPPIGGGVDQIYDGNLLYFKSLKQTTHAAHIYLLGLTLSVV